MAKKHILPLSSTYFISKVIFEMFFLLIHISADESVESFCFKVIKYKTFVVDLNIQIFQRF